MLYIIYVDLFDITYYGIKKKIISQIRVFQSYFGRVYYTVCKGGMIYLMEGEQVIDKELAVTRKMCNDAILGWLDKYEIKRTYIRYALSNKWFLQFLKIQREKGIKSVLEIPTYPYDGELVEGRYKTEDIYYRKQLCNCVEWVATNSEAEKIFNIPCIRLLNGIDAEEQPLHLKRKEEKRIVLIGVCSMAIWHGYERILEGMANYYAHNGSYDFLFKIVGEGSEKKKYLSLVSKYKLQSRVEFCGLLSGEELDKQYQLADIAVSSLGLYKTGIQDVTPIKGAEYCARGIPFICGYHDMRFPENVEYIMKVPNNSEPIDLCKVIEFYENITKVEGYQLKMRDYALKSFTWEYIMFPIIEHIK